MPQSVGLTLDELGFLNGGGEVDCPVLGCSGRIRPIDSQCVQLLNMDYEIKIIYKCIKCNEVGDGAYILKN